MTEKLNGMAPVRKGTYVVVDDLYSVSFHDGHTGPEEQVHIWGQSALSILLVYIIAEDRHIRGEIDDADLERFRKIMGSDSAAGED